MKMLQIIRCRAQAFKKLNGKTIAVRDRPFLIFVTVLCIYIYISNWIWKNKPPESITFFMQFGLKKKKELM